MKLSKGQKSRARAQKKKLLAVGTQNTALKKNVETITFQNPDIKTNPMSERSGRSTSKKSEDEELDLKKARFEVMKFSMNAMSGSEKVDAETALAISLGARPGKRGCVNYKELTANRKIELEKQKAEELLNIKPKLKSKKNSNNRKTKKNTNRGNKNDGIISAKKIINSTKFKQRNKGTKGKR